MNPKNIPVERKVFKHGEFTREYLRFGQGSDVILTFHGFGRKAEDWLVLYPWLKKYTVFAFYDFLHGHSKYPIKRIHKNTLTPKELVGFFEAFILKNNIKTYDLAGYSLGGKTVLTLVQLMPNKINAVWLFAPDGIQITWWYKFASHSYVGKKIYQKIIQNPAPFFQLVSLLVKVKIISKKLERFIMVQMDTQEKRQLVYDVWMIYRQIEPDKRLVANQARKCCIKVHLYFGKYDRIIPPSIGKRFAKILGEQGRLNLLETGHLLLQKETLEVLS